MVHIYSFVPHCTPCPEILLFIVDRVQVSKVLCRHMLNVHCSCVFDLSWATTIHELVVHPKCRVLCLTADSSAHLDNILTAMPSAMEVTRLLKMPRYCIFWPLSWSVMIVMSPEFINGCNFNTYSQNFVQLLVFSFPNRIEKNTGNMLVFAVTL